jgi:hypothetical protein
MFSVKYSKEDDTITIPAGHIAHFAVECRLAILKHREQHHKYIDDLWNGLFLSLWHNTFGCPVKDAERMVIGEFRNFLEVLLLLLCWEGIEQNILFFLFSAELTHEIRIG